MTGASPASATALPISPSILNPLPRRGFLRGLAALPLIGGSVKLLGSPTAVAEPVTYDMLQAYKVWLHHEHRYLSWELADHPDSVAWYGGTHRERYDVIERMVQFVGVGDAASYHGFDGKSKASERAALVLSTVGCDWREREDRQ